MNRSYISANCDTIVEGRYVTLTLEDWSRGNRMRQATVLDNVWSSTTESREYGKGISERSDAI